MDIEITFTPNYFLFGFSWFDKDEEFDYSEFNINFLFVKISFQWY